MRDSEEVGLPFVPFLKETDPFWPQSSEDSLSFSKQMPTVHNDLFV